MKIRRAFVMRRLRLGPETMFARISLLRYDDLQQHLRAADDRPRGQREHARAQDSSWWSPDLWVRRFGADSLAGLAVGLACFEFRSRSDSCALRRSNSDDSPRIEGPICRVGGSPVPMVWQSTEFSDLAILADHYEFVKSLCWKCAVFATWGDSCAVRRHGPANASSRLNATTPARRARVAAIKRMRKRASSCGATQAPAPRRPSRRRRMPPLRPPNECETHRPAGGR